MMNSDGDTCGLKEEKYGDDLGNSAAACEVRDDSDLSDEECVVDCPTERQCSYCGCFENYDRDIFACECGRKLCHRCKGLKKLHVHHRKKMKRLDNEFPNKYARK